MGTQNTATLPNKTPVSPPPPPPPVKWKCRKNGKLLIHRLLCCMELSDMHDNLQNKMLLFHNDTRSAPPFLRAVVSVEVGYKYMKKNHSLKIKKLKVPSLASG